MADLKGKTDKAKIAIKNILNKLGQLFNSFKRKKSRVWVTLIIVILIVSVAIVKKPNKLVILVKDTVEPARIVSVLKQTGVIKPQVGAMVSIGARATGTLEMVAVQVGDNVTEGELIAQIDSRTIEQNIIQARDGYNKAKAEYDKQLKIYPVQKAMQQNVIQSAKSNMEYLTNVYEREKILYDKGYSRKETLEKVEHEMVSAKTEYQKQLLQLEFMEAEHQTNIIGMESELNRLKSILEEQEINLTYTKIYSPIDGVVIEVKSVQGETIVAGLEVANLITVFRPELLEMFVYIDESDVGKVATGMEVRYTVDTYPDKVFNGEISRINLKSVEKDGVVYYIAIVDIHKEDAILLRPEMTANVQIVTQEKDAEITVANTAIKWESGTQIVNKVVGKDRSEKLEVKVGLRGDKRTEILDSDLKEGDEVVVRFGHKDERK